MILSDAAIRPFSYKHCRKYIPEGQEDPVCIEMAAPALRIVVLRITGSC